ncbi:MAG TPA: lytic polysaccharide monooxygenase, partial [Pilimelia sp.]|nr:lytic polysaccharide monooxygenase [Pilimelia sp.]
YMTRPGYDPTQPLKWSDLDATPFHRTENSPAVTNGYYLFNNVRLPQRSGRHLIYSIWQRRLPDSAEAFYSCSDVTFGGTTTPPPSSPAPTTPAPSSPAPTTPAPSSPAPTTPAPTTPPPSTVVPTSPTSTAAPAWAANTAYATGARVTYGGRVYQCRQAHTSLPGWEPPNVPALWTAV